MKNTKKLRKKFKRKTCKSKKCGKKTKYNRRPYGGMNKKVSFGEVEEKEFATPAYPRDSRDLELRLQKPCPPLNKIRPTDFPCKYKQTHFANAYEFAEWYRDYISAKIQSTKDKARHLENVKRGQLEETGRWEYYLPETYRSYDEATGTVEDVRPFAETDEEESKRLLQEKRRQRKMGQQKWSHDVKLFKEQKYKEEEEDDDVYF